MKFEVSFKVSFGMKRNLSPSFSSVRVTSAPIRLLPKRVTDTHFSLFRLHAGAHHLTLVCMSLPLLPFHRSILEEVHDPATSDLVLIARGLGLRRIVCTLLKIYDDPKNLVLLVNATPEEEVGIGEELGIMGCRRPGLRVVSHEMGRKDRCVRTVASASHNEVKL